MRAPSDDFLVRDRALSRCDIEALPLDAAPIDCDLEQAARFRGAVISRDQAPLRLD
jgi:hypothetical protein